MFFLSKKKVSNYILRFAKYTPFIFPKGIVFLSKDYHEGGADILWNTRCESIKSISYFSGDFKWKAVTLSSIISKDDVKKIEQRLQEIKINTMPEYFTNLSKTSIENNGCFTHGLGVFNVNKDQGFDELGNLYLKSDFFDSVFISLFKSPSGLFVLSYYFFMSDKATCFIKDVDVSNLMFYRELVGLNIYKRKNRAVKYVDRRTQSNDLIRHNAMAVVNEAKNIVGYIGEKLNVTPNDFLVGTEFYKNQDVPYFHDENTPRYTDETKLFYVDSSSYNTLNYSDDPSEQFFKVLSFEKDIFDFSYLLCKREELFDRYDNYLKKYYCCYENHLAFIPLYMIHKKISQLMENVSDVISVGKSSELAKHHDVVYDCLSQTESIKKWLCEIEDDYTCNTYEKYHKAMAGIIKNQRKRVDELLNSTKTFYTLSENRVQVENIKYSKRNSRLIFWLIIVQILLASMTIDFLKKGQWYSPVIEAVISFFRGV